MTEKKSKDHRNSFLIWGVIMLTGSICFYLFTQYAAALAAVIWLIAFFRDVRPDEEKAFGKGIWKMQNQIKRRCKMINYLFLHGLGQNASSWNGTVSCMPESFSIECLDLMGLFHHTETTYANLYQAFSEDCSHKSEPFGICGLSLGGILALHYAADHPEKVHSVVLIGAQYQMPKALLKFQNIIFRFMPERSFANMGVDKQALIRLASSMTDLDLSRRLEDISCPVLVVCGERDKVNKNAAKSLCEKTF